MSFDDNVYIHSFDGEKDASLFSLTSYWNLVFSFMNESTVILAVVLSPTEITGTWGLVTTEWPQPGGPLVFWGIPGAGRSGCPWSREGQVHVDPPGSTEQGSEPGLVNHTQPHMGSILIPEVLIGTDLVPEQLCTRMAKARKNWTPETPSIVIGAIFGHLQSEEHFTHSTRQIFIWAAFSCNAKPICVMCCFSGSSSGHCS